MRNGILFFFLVLVFFSGLAPVHARAEVWTYLGTDPAGKWYYDKESLVATRTGTCVFWVKVVHARDALKELVTEEKRKGTYKEGLESWNYSMSNYACECDKKTCGLQSSIAYDKRGTVLSTSSASPVTKWAAFKEGSILDKLVDTVCNKKK